LAKFSGKLPILRVKRWQMTIAICDDVEIICGQIEKLVKNQMPNCDTKRFASGGRILKEKEKFDIIFLDIQMEGINGIEVARLLRNKKEDAVLIFITGIKEYVFEAFDVSAFHYLLKPIEEKKFIEVFARAVAESERVSCLKISIELLDHPAQNAGSQSRQGFRLYRLLAF